MRILRNGMRILRKDCLLPKKKKQASIDISGKL